MYGLTAVQSGVHLPNRFCAGHGVRDDFEDTFSEIEMTGTMVFAIDPRYCRAEALFGANGGGIFSSIWKTR